MFARRRSAEKQKVFFFYPPTHMDLMKESLDPVRIRSEAAEKRQQLLSEDGNDPQVMDKWHAILRSFIVRALAVHCREFDIPIAREEFKEAVCTAEGFKEQRGPLIEDVQIKCNGCSWSIFVRLVDDK
jgi:hypothetical protein